MLRSASVRRLLLAFALLPVPLAAHDFWVEPSAWTPGAGEPVALGLRVGEAWKGEPLPRIPPLIARFVVRGPGGEAEVGGRPGADPAGQVAPLPGLSVVLYESRPYPMDIEGAIFEKYLREEGLEKIATVRAQRGEKGQATRERFSRCAKLLLRTQGAAGASDAWKRPFGCTVEIVPEADPTLVKGPLPVRVLRDGKPLANALVIARPQADPAATVKVRTDAAGRARLALPRGGTWMLKAIDLQPAPAGAGVTWESFWASLTFEAPAR